MRDGRLTTKELIAAYIEKSPKVRDLAKAKALLAYVIEGSRSPRESGLCMFMSLLRATAGMHWARPSSTRRSSSAMDTTMGAIAASRVGTHARHNAYG